MQTNRWGVYRITREAAGVSEHWFKTPVDQYRESRRRVHLISSCDPANENKKNDANS